MIVGVAAVLVVVVEEVVVFFVVEVVVDFFVVVLRVELVFEDDFAVVTGGAEVDGAREVDDELMGRH